MSEIPDSIPGELFWMNLAKNPHYFLKKKKNKGEYWKNMGKFCQECLKEFSKEFVDNLLYFFSWEQKDKLCRFYMEFSGRILSGMLDENPEESQKEPGKIANNIEIIVQTVLGCKLRACCRGVIGEVERQYSGRILRATNEAISRRISVVIAKKCFEIFQKKSFEESRNWSLKKSLNSFQSSEEIVK